MELIRNIAIEHSGYSVFDQWHMPYIVAFLAAIAFTAIAGLALERFIFRPFWGKPGALLSACVASMGASFLLAHAAMVAFEMEHKDVGAVLGIGVVQFGAVRISYEKLLIVVCGLLITIGVLLAIRYLKAGRALQAIAQDRDAAALMGININRVNAMGFALACVIAGAAGALVCPLYYVFPFMGAGIIMKAFIIIILGGLGSLPGAVIGGFILGFVDSFGLTIIGYPANIIGFVIVIILLVFRPTGILGREFRVH